jgi:hypothetical protein
MPTGNKAIGLRCERIERASIFAAIGTDLTCEACGGAIRVIACIKDSWVVEEIITNLDERNISA